jgi:hypothetical protein
MAAFVQRNMSGTLSAQESHNVAGFFHQQSDQRSTLCMAIVEINPGRS